MYVLESIEPAAKSNHLKKMKILIAEDDRSFRKGLAFALHDLGYVVTEATDGKEAIQLFQNSQFDLVVSDLVMPNIDGLEFYNTIQNIKPAIKFIMITSFADNERAKEAKAFLKDSFIEKSYDLDNLIKRVNDLLTT